MNENIRAFPHFRGNLSSYIDFAPDPLKISLHKMKYNQRRPLCFTVLYIGSVLYVGGYCKVMEVVLYSNSVCNQNAF